ALARRLAGDRATAWRSPSTPPHPPPTSGPASVLPTSRHLPLATKDLGRVFGFGLTTAFAWWQAFTVSDQFLQRRLAATDRVVLGLVTVDAATADLADGRHMHAFACKAF